MKHQLQSIQKQKNIDEEEEDKRLIYYKESSEANNV